MPPDNVLSRQIARSTSCRANVILFLFCFQFTVLTNCTERKTQVDSSEGNRLVKSGSPYLREHSDNPVDWYEWGPEALAKAKQENKPLIISIGYSSCHWCHVMEEESFMDTAVARIMNDNFVSIKIDREERPDIDQIYLNAAQLISGNSGWPLNAFALPDGKPFFAATYFPKQQWIKILEQVIGAYKSDKENVVRQAESLTEGIVRESQVITVSEDSARAYDQKQYQNSFIEWQSAFDYESGGIAGAPKFPMPVVWESLLQYHHLTDNEKALKIVTTTLDKMLRGGIYDPLAGGFSRYSTDENWNVPHFEKMLYDNGQLVSLYAHAYQVTRTPLYAETIKKTLDFIKREMTSPKGGFYSSLNADSEGEEGKFYVWTKEEIKKSIYQKSADLIIEYYDIADSGNWENGKNILHRKFTAEEIAIKNKIPKAEAVTVLADAERELLTVRNRRVHPSLDDKILVSWNAIMIKGYLDAYFALGEPQYLQTALTNAHFIEKNMMQPDGRLMRNFKDGKASIDAFLDDYALLARAFIHLYQATFDIHWLENGRTLVKYAIAHFRDAQSGLFYYTSDESENLVARNMEISDNVIPSSNSVLAEVLFLLGEYYSDASYVQMSVSMLNKVNNVITTGGPYYSNWTRLMGLITYQPHEVAIVGEDALEKSKPILRHYLPMAIFMGGETAALPLLENKLLAGRTMIYVCRNRICKMPEENVDRALKQLVQNR